MNGSTPTRGPLTLRVSALACLALSLSLGLAACSGSEPEKTKQGGKGAKQGKGAEAPKPKGNVDGAARELAAAVKAKDCEAVQRLSFTGIPKSGAPNCEKLLGPLEGLKPGRSAEYGTAAVVDFTTNAKPLTFAFLVNRDGDFRWALRVPREKDEQIAGTDAPNGNDLDATAAAATEALRSGSCDELTSAAQGVVPQPRMPAKICTKREGLREKLAKDPDAKPQSLGANERLAFYSLTPRPNGPYDTLVLLQDGKRSAFARDFPLGSGRKKKQAP